MREIYFGKNTYTFPDKWEELSREQFLQLVECLLDFREGKTNAAGCRATWFCKIAEIDTKRRDNKNDLFWENIYRASDLFDFFFEIEYLDPETGEPKSLKTMPREIRKKLRKKTPQELPDIPEFRWASKLKHRYVIDAVFAKNLLPEIIIDGALHPGYRFGLSGNLITTNLTAERFIDANIAYNEYVNDPKPEHLDMLVHVLYFNTEKAIDTKLLNKISARVKFAIVLNFQAIMAFLMQKTRYAIIWNRKGTSTDGKLTVGMADTVYQLSKDGYGPVGDIGNYNLIRYLDLLLKNIIDSVTMLNENEINIGDIAERTGLTIAQIKNII